MVVPIAMIMIIPALVEAHALIGRAARRPLLLGSSVIALAGWTAAAAAPAYSPDHQQRFTIEHVSDFESGKSFWSVLNDGAPLPHAFASAGDWRRTKLSFSERLRWIAPARALAGIPPEVRVVEIGRNVDERSLRMRLQANGAQRIILVLPEKSHLRSAGVAPFVRSLGDAGSSGKFVIACTGRSCDGAEFTVDVTGDPQPVTVVGARDGLPDFAAPLVQGRPANARPQYTPDETLTVSRVRL
jgi:hypothetical protein